MTIELQHSHVNLALKPTIMQQVALKVTYLTTLKYPQQGVSRKRHIKLNMSDLGSTFCYSSVIRWKQEGNNITKVISLLPSNKQGNNDAGDIR